MPRTSVRTLVLSLQRGTSTVWSAQMGDQDVSLAPADVTWLAQIGEVQVIRTPATDPGDSDFLTWMERANFNLSPDLHLACGEAAGSQIEVELLLTVRRYEEFTLKRVGSVPPARHDEPLDFKGKVMLWLRSAGLSDPDCETVCTDRGVAFSIGIRDYSGIVSDMRFALSKLRESEKARELLSQPGEQLMLMRLLRS